jgi:hypothetical protein
MNNPFNFQNDLNGFRSSIGNSIATYDHNVNVLNAGVLRKKTDAIRHASETLEKGAELVRTGLETEGAIAGGKVIHAAGKAIYKAVSNKMGRSAANNTENTSTDETEPSSGGGSNNTSSDQAVEEPQGEGVEMRNMSRGGGEGSGETEGLGRTIEPDDNISRPTNANETDMGGDQGSGVEMTDRVGANQPGRPTEQPETKEEEPRDYGEPEDVGENPMDRDVPDDQLRSQGNMGDASTTDNLGADLTSDAQDAISAGTEGAEGAGQALSGVGDALSGAAETGASALTGAAEGGLAAGESALADAAAATSWIPFIGEVLGGIAAVGGLVTAGVGIYDDVVGGDQQKKADEMAASLKPGQLPKVSVAGAYTAPITSSVAV